VARYGGTHQPFERDAWWSHYWDDTGGRLPVVDALLASPALPRQPYQGTDDTPVEPEPPEETQLTDAELAAVCEEAGFIGDALVTAIAIALAESGGRTDAVNVTGNTPPSRDRGLFQINDYWHPEIDDDCAFDALCNASAAYDISEGGDNWQPWSAYQAGTYEAFLDRARAVTCASGPTPEQIKNACWNSLGVGYNPDAALAKYAAAHGLGVPLAQEHTFTIDCAYYIGQPFVGDSGVTFVWAAMGDWGNVNQQEL
jgi:hypothetical protein